MAVDKSTDCAGLATINGSRLPAIPDGWQAKADMIDQCQRAGRRLVVWVAMLVARSREDFETPEEWVAACVEKWGWQKAHVHHLRQVGDFILANKSHVFHETLMGLEWMKLQSISRLPKRLVGPFMERVDVAGMSRDEVRDRVNAWLERGEAAGGNVVHPTLSTKPKPKTQPAAQLDFMGMLFATCQQAIGDEQREALSADARVKPRTAMINGLTLVNVAAEKWSRARSVEPEDIEESIDELEKLAAILRDRLVLGNEQTALLPE